MYSKPLCRGSLHEMINYPLGFPTTLPAMFGLPPIHDNLAEGIVVKPTINQVLGTKNGDEERVIFKRKLDRFSERRPIHGGLPKSSETKKGKSKSGCKGAVNNFRASDFEVLRYEMLALVTEQRVVNTISKLGLPESEADWKMVLKNFKRDVMNELEADNKELVEDCRKNATDWKNLVADMQQECAEVVAAYQATLKGEP